jgi:hypothetical protein
MTGKGAASQKDSPHLLSLKTNCNPPENVGLKFQITNSHAIHNKDASAVPRPG